ncbi:MAG TPA: MOSC N-terminal beta barrel domain-containing protein [Gemmatimonadales bacterium]|nr:MOSC N-terminal beta barrel domain-containing protein [Gemmatimonadales bacterium]
MTLTLSAINLYPVKACAGIGVPAWEVDLFGLRLDRRWAVVDLGGHCITQREHPGLSVIRPTLRPPHLQLDAPHLPTLVTPLAPQGGRRVTVEILGSRTPAVAPDPAADRWFTRHLGMECSLVFMPDDGFRPVDPRYAPEGTRTSFTDGFPFLLVGEASLAELNRRLETPLPMNRFRPNLVVAGSEPFDEDAWRSITIGELGFDVVKPCDRCVVTTTDQAIGLRAGDEPLRTLATFRRRGGKVLFGQNVVHRGTGTLRVRDEVRTG